MTNRIAVDMPVKVNNLNSPYHGRKGRVLRSMGADRWEVSLQDGPHAEGNFMVFR